jgi:hypothetical protein
MASRDTMLNRQRDIDAMIRDMMQYREFDLSNQRMHEQWRMSSYVMHSQATSKESTLQQQREQQQQQQREQ